MVKDNLGLVLAHLKRYRSSRPPGRWGNDDEWDDLVQDGCLGLIRAVQTYSPERGLSFATFAVPRIHKAIMAARMKRQNRVRQPQGGLSPRRPSRGGEKGRPYQKGKSAVRRRTRASAPATASCAALPRVWACSPHKLNLLLASCRTWGGEAEGGNEPVTAGALLRLKLEAALKAAADDLAAAAKSRPDRSALVRLLADQRVLVAEERCRATLRKIAQATRSSYGRVVECEASLKEGVRRILEADSEFGELWAMTREGRQDIASPLEEATLEALRRRGIERLVELMAGRPEPERGAMLLAVLQRSEVDLGALVRSTVGRWSDEQRTRLLAEWTVKQGGPAG